MKPSRNRYRQKLSAAIYTIEKLPGPRRLLFLGKPGTLEGGCGGQCFVRPTGMVSPQRQVSACAYEELI